MIYIESVSGFLNALIMRWQMFFENDALDYLWAKSMPALFPYRSKINHLVPPREDFEGT